MIRPKKLWLTPAFFAAALALSAGVRIGDTYEQVIAADGPPASQMDAGAVRILFYPAQTIRLKAGRVIALTAPPPAPPPPPAPAPGSPAAIMALFPKNFVGHPEFDTVEGKQAAGTACLARRENDRRIYLLTVRHLLGPMGGFPSLIPSEQVASFVNGIALTGLFGGTHAYDAHGLPIPPEADPRAPLYELAMFQTNIAFARDAAMLADADPTPGETVWLIAHVRGGVPEGTLIHRLTVTDTGAWLDCDFENQEIITNGASGAPVVNAEGKIAGIYAGHFWQNNRKCAYIIPVSLIRRTLPPL